MSPIRQAHVEQTRDRICDATLALIGEVGITGISIPLVAARAGLAAQTVYRHFPDVGALLAAFNDYMLRRTHAPEGPVPPEELVLMAGLTYRTCDEHEAMSRAMLASRASLGAASQAQLEGLKRRNDIAEQSLAGLTRGRPKREARRIAAAFRLFMSMNAWQHFHDTWGFDAAEASEAAAWALGAMLKELKREARRGK